MNWTLSVTKGLFALSLAVTAGCSTTGERSESRSSIALQSFSLLNLPTPWSRRSERAVAWNEWGDEHLQDGDILFMKGDYYVLMGTINFSDIETDLMNSRFAHTGLIAIEEGRAVVYHMTEKGVIRDPFGKIVTRPNIHSVAVQRPVSVAQQTRESAVEYCRRMKQDKMRFDNNFRLDNDRLYCSELVELAYRSGGFPLSEPVSLKDLPNYARHARLIQLASAITPIEPDQRIYLPGNDDIGIWSNPALEVILDLPDSGVLPPNDDHQTSNKSEPFRV